MREFDEKVKALWSDVGGSEERAAILRVPAHLRAGIYDWIIYGQLPGGFLTSVLENDLIMAMMRADATSRRFIYEVVSYLYNHAPGPCWGSEKKVKDWTGLLSEEVAGAR